MQVKDFRSVVTINYRQLDTFANLEINSNKQKEILLRVHHPPQELSL